MKVNTDGVLLAALAEADPCHHILDIGTGTGVIALMLAQRFEKAQIHAVEIDAEASATAEKNFKNSVFSNRIQISNVAIEQFHAAEKYDLIVSNPPFFVNNLKNAEVKKGVARHTNDVFFDELIAKVHSLLSADGCFWFILPVKQAEVLIVKANLVGLFVSKQICLHSDVHKPAFRKIVCLSRSAVKQADANFYIYESEKVYTQAYKVLLKDFFLGY
jgi:tRNA1Val (adenine37-N6)-methyltransferase